MSHEQLLRSLEHELALLSERGKTERAADARRLAVMLKQAVTDHGSAANEVARCNTRTKADGATPADALSLALAQSIMDERWAAVVGRRELAVRFLAMRR